jgi:integrase/recombinase XerC
MTTFALEHPGEAHPGEPDEGVDGACPAPAWEEQDRIPDAMGQNGHPILVDRSGHMGLSRRDASSTPPSEDPAVLDAWIVPPHTHSRRTHGRGRDQKGHAMTQLVGELAQQFCLYQLKQRGRTNGGVEAARWVLERFLRFVRARTGRHARVTDLTGETVQQWMDDMAAHDLALSTMRTRQAILSSFCAWLVKRQILTANPVATLDRPPHRSEPPAQVPSGALMDALIAAAHRRQRPRDLALFLILRYSGMRRESVATLQVRHLDGTWGLRGVLVKGGRTRDIPLPTAVMDCLWTYVEQVVRHQDAGLTAETPLFWSSWGRRGIGKARRPMTGKNIWRLCKVYGRMIGAPRLKPHDLRHGVAMEVYEQHHDLEEVRALLGHARIETTQLYARIRPPHLKQTVEFYEARATQLLSNALTEKKAV